MKSIILTTICLATVANYATAKKQTSVIRPNILFCIADDQSFPHAGAYGCDWVKTPGFDRVAKEGILFTNAYTPNAKCAPSRASLLTGRNSWQLEEAGNHIAFWPVNKYQTYCETLSRNGYFVGFTGKPWAPGDMGKIDGKDRELNGKAFQARQTNPPTTGISKDDYAYEIEYFDSHLEKMLKILDARGELKNTIVVVTADNGMPFPRSKGLEYEYSNHMPLAIMWPEGIKKPGRKESSYVSFIDIAPTFLEIAGVKWQTSGMAESPGRSLKDIFDAAPKKDRSYILLGQERHDYGRQKNQGYPIRSILQNGFLYINNFKPELWPAGNPETGYLNTDGSPTKTNILNLRRSSIDWSFWLLCFAPHPQEELYQISVDRDCMVNLANAEPYRDVKEKLKKKLFDNLNNQQDPRVLGNGDVFDHYRFNEEIDENFYERFMNGEIKKYQTGWVNRGDYEKGIIDLKRE
jgi:N-sulfoglucosamine sulfohydrolase